MLSASSHIHIRYYYCSIYTYIFTTLLQHYCSTASLWYCITGLIFFFNIVRRLGGITSVLLLRRNLCCLHFFRCPSMYIYYFFLKNIVGRLRGISSVFYYCVGTLVLEFVRCPSIHIYYITTALQHYCITVVQHY